MATFSGRAMRNDYEKAYCDAREVLYNRGKKIGGPLRVTVGVRYCTVDGLPLTDRDLLIEAWGERLADEIIVELAGPDSPPACCPEANRLWQQYSDVTRRNLKILIQQQVAASKQDSAALAQLAPLLRQAAECRRQIRRSLLDHETRQTSCAA
jgi:hypothetical protein